MNLQFQYPWILVLLWMVPVIGVVWHFLAGRRRAGQSLVSSVMAAKLAPAPAATRRLWQLSLFMGGLVLALIAAARPQWGMQDETVYQRGRDLLVVLDVSRSMLAQDVHPSRLGRAKVDLLDLVKELRGDRMGLLAFRGRPVLLCPLTTDYGFMVQTLEGAGVDSAPFGETDIGGAILEALQNFDDDEGSHKAIILITDGDDLAGKAMEAAAKAKEKGVVVFTVGFGSSEGASIPSVSNKKEALTFQGKEVVSKLNNILLRDLAEATGGAYVPVGLANVKLGDLYRNHLSRISARDLEESSQRRYVERYQIFLFPAVLLFLAVAFLSRGQVAGRNPPKIKAILKGNVRLPPLPTAALVLFIGVGLPLQAATNQTEMIPLGREGARLAQRLYLAGNYEESAVAYQAAAKTAAQTHREDYFFNAGCALLKAGKTDEASDIFRSLTGGEGELGAKAAYNLGCALFATGSAPMQENAATPPDPALAERRVQALKQAGTAFQKVLRQQPDHADSRKNLAVVAGMTEEVEEQAKIIRLMAEHGQSQPGALADLMLLQQRKLIQDIPAAFTNTTPTLIEALESLAADQDKTADLMIPLKGKLLQAMSQSQPNNTNAPQQIAQINAFAESIRDNMFEAAAALRNLDRSSYAPALKAEAAVYTLWKGLAGYPQLLREDIQRQTNTITLTAPVNTGVPPASDELTQSIQVQQKEALNLTGLFKQRFEQEVPSEGISRPVKPASTNAPPGGTNAMEQVLSPADRKKIVELTGQAMTLQQSAESAASTALTDSLAHQRKAYTILKEIEALLPKDKQPQENQQQDQQQDQKKQDQPQSQEQKQDQPKPQKSPPKQEDKKDQMSPEDLKRLLDKAKQREKEHEQEKRERDSDMPLSPSERDW